MSRPKGIPTVHLHVVIPASVAARIKKLRKRFRFNASEICGQALEDAAAKLEHEDRKD